jgi:alpha-L-rhamnosidase
MLPEALRQQAADRLAENVRRYNTHLTTGFLGTPYLCHVLSRFGHLDLAYELLLQESYPSWLYPVKMGATTIWERWDGQRPDSTFQTPGMNSFNHYAYGAIGDWMYRVIAGINPSPEAPGYQHIIIRPQPGGNLTYAQATLDTYYGRVVSHWELQEGRMRLQVEVPANTYATIHLPGAAAQAVSEGGRPLEAVAGLRLGTPAAGAQVLEAGSGVYRFEWNITQ